MNDLDDTTFARFAERFARIERQVPEPPPHKVQTAVGSRRLGLLSPVAGLVGIAILLAAAVGLAVIGSRPSPIPSSSPAALTIPPDSAPPAIVLDAYLRALQAGDCGTASQLTMPLVLGKDYIDLCAVTRVTAFAIPGDPVVVNFDTVRLTATIRITGVPPSISAGQITWFYSLQRQTSGAWRVIDGFGSIPPSMLTLPTPPAAWP